MAMDLVRLRIWAQFHRLKPAGSSPTRLNRARLEHWGVRNALLSLMPGMLFICCARLVFFLAIHSFRRLSGTLNSLNALAGLRI